MKMAVFWIVAFTHHPDVGGRKNTSETSVNFYQTTWHNIPEDRHYSVLSAYGSNLIVTFYAPHPLKMIKYGGQY
jgi:hypothetical protein